MRVALGLVHGFDLCGHVVLEIADIDSLEVK